MEGSAIAQRREFTPGYRHEAAPLVIEVVLCKSAHAVKDGTFANDGIKQ